MATGAEPALLLAAFGAKLIDAGPIPGVVEGSVGVNAVHPMRGDVCMAIGAVVGLGQARDVERCRVQQRGSEIGGQSGIGGGA